MGGVDGEGEGGEGEGGEGEGNICMQHMYYLTKEGGRGGGGNRIDKTIIIFTYIHTHEGQSVG